MINVDTRILPSAEDRMDELTILTVERIISDIYFSASAVGPDACAAVFVEVQPGGASDFDRVAVDAIVEDVADGRVRMSEEPVPTGALLRRLRRF